MAKMDLFCDHLLQSSNYDQEHTVILFSLSIDINLGQCTITSEFSVHFPLLSVQLDGSEKLEGRFTAYACEFIARLFLTCMWPLFTLRICYWFRTRNCIKHHDFHISYWLNHFCLTEPNSFDYTDLMNL